MKQARMAALYDDVPDAPEIDLSDYDAMGMQWGADAGEKPTEAHTDEDKPDSGTNQAKKPSSFEELY